MRRTEQAYARAVGALEQERERLSRALVALNDQ